MKNKINGVLGLVVALVIGFVFLNRNEPVTNASSVEQEIASTSENVNPQMMTEKVDIRTNEKKQLTTITKAEIRAIRDSLPQKQEVTKEMNNNPHSPSKTLMTFAKTLGPAMEKAFVNENDANALTRELEGCAIDNSIADAARALCVQDIEKLSGYHPNLKTKASDLRAEMSPEVLKILETNDSFMKKE